MCSLQYRPKRCTTVQEYSLPDSFYSRYKFRCQALNNKNVDNKRTTALTNK